MCSYNKAERLHIRFITLFGIILENKTFFNEHQLTATNKSSCNYARENAPTWKIN